jgi:hypothetical protein
MANGSSAVFGITVVAAFSAVDGVNFFDGVPSVENILYWIKGIPDIKSITLLKQNFHSIMLILG